MKKHYVSGRFSVKTNIGKVRLTNEDRALAMVNAKGNVMLVVCDGMGGQNKGDVASQIAYDTFQNAFKESKGIRTVASAKHWLKKYVRKANNIIFEEANNNTECEGMGTTITAALIVNNHLILAQIGDSRLYRLKDKEFTQLSEDQTYVSYLLKIGEITEEAAKTHPKRHVLMNALGIYATASVEVTSFPYNDETIMLCSDGLYNNVPTTDMAAIVKGSDTVEQKVNELISLGLSNGGSDNIAVVLWEADK